MKRKKLVILGSTGSIGRNVLDVARAHADRFEVIGLSAHERGKLLAEQVREFHPRIVCLTSDEGVAGFRGACGDAKVEIREGEESLSRLAGDPEADIVVNAVVGAAGLRPTVAALEAGRPLALANKESLVLAGEIVMGLAAQRGTVIRPIDSELSALWQCLADRPREGIRKVHLTASGGPFRGLDEAELARVTAGDALRHPVWEMGPRITIDSATLMNKGFEILETHWLFGFPFSDIEAIVHPQSAVHAILEFVDGFSIALVSRADMRLSIQYALTFPERLPMEVPRLDLAELGGFTFEMPDLRRFPCLQLAREAGEAGMTYPAVLNGADEMAVRAFLDGQLRFVDIPRLIESCLSGHKPVSRPAVEDILEADRWARAFCRNEVEALS
ncbi:MAG: 1-deoxy-D-xylulose-5-phosphate reductoisomerase [Candidatus Eisenbacteria sp.]|nr:1-deoxy-D-xylulose-5-phosphate reductoisomerase [Candidatus Eisenbacteria bacterium]